MSGQTPGASSWSTALTWSTETPLASMIADDRSIRPWVCERSGDGLSVQLTKRARRPEKSHWSLVRSSGGMASIITSVDQGFHIAAHDRDGTRSAFPTGPFGSVLRVCERGAIGADEEFPGLDTHGAELLRGVLSCANWRGSDKKAWRRRGRGRSAPDAQRLRGDKASGRQPQREPPRPHCIVNLRRARHKRFRHPTTSNRIVAPNELPDAPRSAPPSGEGQHEQRPGAPSSFQS